MNKHSIKAISDILQKKSLDAILLWGSANKRWLGALPGSGVWIIVTNKKQIQLLDGRYVTEAEETIGFDTVVVAQGGQYQAIISTLKAIGVRRIGIEESLLSINQANKFSSFELVGVSKLLLTCRSIKTKEEIENVKAACRITDKSLFELLPQIHVGMTEREIVGKLYNLIYKNGAEGMAFDPVVSSGIRTAMPHGRATNRVIAAGDLLLIDFGVKVLGYESDMTRTFAVGYADSKIRNLHRATVTVQNDTKKLYKKGQTTQLIHNYAVKRVKELHYDGKFTHGLGHGIGLGEGEKPILNSHSVDILTENMIATCEPGIYLPGIGGVRIEDDVLITSTTPVSLTRFPRDLMIVGEKDE